MMNKEKILKESFYSPEIGLISSEKLFKKLKDKGVSRKEVQEFVNKQESYQLHKQPAKVHHYFPIVSNYLNEIIQVDLADFSDISSTNDGYKYLLIFIDVMSRYATVYPIKNKTSTTINELLNKFIRKTPNIRKIMSDNGSEFINSEYKNILQRHNIEPIYINVNEQKGHKLAIVDRFTRTIRSMINKYLSMNDTTRYINVLPKIVENYNNTYHSTIESTPSKPDVEHIKEINNRKTMDALIEEKTYEIGDKVRYLKNPVLFQKGSLPNWSKTIHSIVDKTAHSYKLNNDRSYKYYELQLVPTVQSQKIIETRTKANEPSKEQLRRINTIRRRLAKEGIDISNVIKEKRERIPTDRFKL